MVVRTRVGADQFGAAWAEAPGVIVAVKWFRMQNGRCVKVAVVAVCSPLDGSPARAPSSR